MCGNTQTSDLTASFHQMPKEVHSRAKWLATFELNEQIIQFSSRVCSRCFAKKDLKILWTQAWVSNQPSESVGI